MLKILLILFKKCMFTTLYVFAKAHISILLFLYSQNLDFYFYFFLFWYDVQISSLAV